MGRSRIKLYRHRSSERAVNNMSSKRKSMSTKQPIVKKGNLHVFKHPSSKNGDCQYESIARNLKRGRVRRHVTSHDLRHFIARKIKRPDMVDNTTIHILWNMNDQHRIYRNDDVPVAMKRQVMYQHLTEKSAVVKYYGNEYTLRQFSEFYQVSFCICQRDGHSLRLVQRIGDYPRCVLLSLQSEHYDSLYVKHPRCTLLRWVHRWETIQPLFE